MNQDKSSENQQSQPEKKQMRPKRERQNRDELCEERTFKNYSTGEMERVIVKPDTEVPVLPSKADRCKQPNEDTFHEKLDKMDDEKEKLWEDFKKFAKEVRQSAYNSTKKDGQTTNLFTSLKEKQAARKILRTEMKELKIKSDEHKDTMDKLEEQKNEMKLKMKKQMRAEEMEELLKEMKHQQANGHISLYDEKILIKNIQDLEDSIPYARPLEALEAKRAPLKKQKDETNKLKKAQWEKIQEMNKEIDELSGEFDIIKKTQKDTFESMDPAIDEKKKVVTSKSDEIKEGKKKVISEYRAGCKAYDEQQQVIRKVEWMTQAKVRLVKYKTQLDEEAAFKAQQIEERKELQDNVYSEEIRMCQFLIRYCKTFQKKVQVEQKVDQVKDTSCLQNEVLQVVQKKKEVNMDFHKQTKGKKQHKVTKNVEKKEDDNKISHKLDVLEFFEQMRMIAPTKNKIEETIKLLEEKEKYFKEQNEIKKNENVDVIEEEKKKLREKENESKKRQSNQEKKKNDKKMKMSAAFKDEEYPEMN